MSYAPVGNVSTQQSVAVSTVLTSWNRTVRVNAAGGPITITLPEADLGRGQTIEVIKTDTSVNIVTVQVAAGDNVNGGVTTQAFLFNAGESVYARSDGSTSVLVTAAQAGFILPRDFIFVTKTADQAAVVATTDITFDVASVGTGGIVFDGTLFTLRPNQSYLLQAALEAFNFGANPGFISYQWVDTANNPVGVASVNSMGTCSRADSTSQDTTQPIASAFVSPLVSTQVKVRCTVSSAGGATVSGAAPAAVNCTYARITVV